MSKDKFFLDFIGIGVEKGGSTWLGKCISEHPEIWFPKGREIYFFNDVDAHFLKFTTTKYERGIKWYKSQFVHCPNGKKKGEWAITYICTKKTARRIKKHFPEVKLIAVLRNPVDRAFSQYLYEVRLGLIDKSMSFEEVLKVRPDYTQKGYYAKQIKDYLEFFRKDQLLILIYEKVKESPEKYVKKVWNFLGLEDKNYIPPSLKKRINTAGTALFPKVNYFMIKTEYFLRSHGLDIILQFLEATEIRNLALKIRDLNNKKYSRYPQMNEKTRLRLSSLYKGDITKLERIIGQDLSLWKDV